MKATILFLLGFSFVASSCRTHEAQVAEVANDVCDGYMLGGDGQPVECQILSSSPWFGDAIVSLSPSSLIAGERFCRGISGAPVYTSAGRLLGAVSMTPGTTGDGVMCIRRTTDGWAEVGRDLVNRLDEMGHLHPIDSESLSCTRRKDRDITSSQSVLSGTRACLLEVSGSLVLGGSGRVTTRKGELAAVLGHLYEALRPGPCLLPLYSAKGVAVVAMDHTEAMDLVVPVDLVGTVVFNGKHGCIAVIGQAPPQLTISATVKDMSGCEVLRVAYQMVIPTLSSERPLERALADMTRRLAFLEGTTPESVSGSLRLSHSGEWAPDVKDISVDSHQDIASMISTFRDVAACLDAAFWHAELSLEVSL